MMIIINEQFVTAIAGEFGRKTITNEVGIMMEIADDLLII
jgi:hypothetical protein